MASKIDERIKSVEAKLAEMKARKKAQEAARISRESKKNRAAETRRKILVGAAVLSEAANDPTFAASLAMILEVRLTRPDDRKTAGLEPLIAPPGQTNEETENGQNP